MLIVSLENIYYALAILFLIGKTTYHIGYIQGKKAKK